ncbi:urea transporter [Actinomadura nitritigenes]|uniref:Urea transporter n=1 Tax=Actinomadura nitritigenes TaxID=134602 RepID=A0ABS3R905_9ACTN|nr:urea transporter [Actinomadura nitritigenes]MBO2442714.1 urea transporter [Actinomadura nitritigenes]
MDSPPTSAGARGEPPRPPADRIRDGVLAILRGVAQVDFQPGHWTGLIFLAALFVGGWQFGAFGLLGCVTATLTAWLLGVPRDRISAGLEGFSGTLVGVGLVLYLGTSWVTALVVIGAAIGASMVNSALNVLLKSYDLPALTAPFCVVTLLMLIAAPSFHRVWVRHPRNVAPAVAHPGTAVSWTDVWHGFFNGFGQIFFQDKWYVGLIFLVGLAVSSRTVAAVACAASLIGLLMGWWLGAQAANLGAGLYGYNAVLTGIALAGTFVALGPVSLGYAAIGAATAAVTTPAITNTFGIIGGHALTWPFVLVTWVFLAAVPTLSRLRRTA